MTPCRRASARWLSRRAALPLIKGEKNFVHSVVTLIDGQPLPEDVGKWVGFGPDSDVFEAILTPGSIILLTSSPHTPPVPDGARLRRVRIIRDYGMYDRREAPQSYPDVPTRS